MFFSPQEVWCDLVSFWVSSLTLACHGFHLNCAPAIQTVLEEMKRITVICIPGYTILFCAEYLLHETKINCQLTSACRTSVRRFVVFLLQLKWLAAGNQLIVALPPPTGLEYVTVDWQDVCLPPRLAVGYKMYYNSVFITATCSSKAGF